MSGLLPASLSISLVGGSPDTMMNPWKVTVLSSRGLPSFVSVVAGPTQT